MSQVESQTVRNGELFSNAYSALAKRAHSLDSPNVQKEERISWYAGGTFAAELAVNTCEPLSRAWGSGDEQTAVHLGVIFTMPIILRFYGYSDALMSGEWRYLFAYSLRNLFEMNPGLSLSTEPTGREYLELAKQFEFDDHAIPKLGGIVLHYSLEMEYLVAQSLAVLGRPSDFSLGNVCLPVATLREFYVQGGVGTPHLTDLSSYFAMFDAVGIGFTRSMEVLRTLRSQAESEAKGRNA